MAIEIWEAVVPELRDRLETNLPAVITTINSTQTNPTFPIENPQRVLDYIPTVADMYNFPIVGISDGIFYLEDDVGWGGTGRCEFTIVVFLQHPDPRTLAWQLRRYAQAITRVCLATRSVGDGWGITLKQVRPGPTLGRDSDPKQWVSTVAVSIEVKSEQDL